MIFYRTLRHTISKYKKSHKSTKASRSANNTGLSVSPTNLCLVRFPISRPRKHLTGIHIFQYHISLELKTRYKLSSGQTGGWKNQWRKAFIGGRADYILYLEVNCVSFRWLWKSCHLATSLFVWVLLVRYLV